MTYPERIIEDSLCLLQVLSRNRSTLRNNNFLRIHFNETPY